MDGRFTLTIDLGDAAMRTQHDVADALDKVARKLHDGAYPIEGPIADENGNTVGSWSFDEGGGE